MTYLLYGANTYEIDRGLNALLEELTKKYPGIIPERLDGAEVEPNQLPDLLQGISLFGEQRIIIMRAPSVHKALWSVFEDYIDKVSDTTELIIVDSAIDKRTRTYKALLKTADAHEFTEFGPRSSAVLQTWVTGEAKRQNLSLTRESVTMLIDRVGYDQWALGNAITKLALVEDGSPDRIRDLIDASPSTNAFEVFEYACRGDADAVHGILNDLQQTADPYALVGLLGSQVYQLALVAYSTKTPVELGKLLGSSPYPLQKLSPVARRMSKAQVRRAVDALTECDRDLKRSVAPPWTLVTRALLKIAAN